ncbi:MAG: HD-GYP domain-containing protein [Gammaproteobacteria bacterium]
MAKIKINSSDIGVGRALSWAIYDENGRLLLNKGEVIATEKQLTILLERGLYRTNTGESERKKESAPVEDHFSPFELVYEFVFRLNKIFVSIIEGRQEFINHLDRLCNDLQILCEKDANAALGSIHLCQEKPYTVWHSIHIALLSELAAKRLEYPRERRLSIMRAALTGNIGMLRLQEILYEQAGPLTEEQRKRVNDHCEKSVLMLKNAGVEDQLWLELVLQHHENISGRGYPRGLKGDDILKEARLLNLADRYGAMVSPRANRTGLPPQNALRDLLLKKGEDYDEKLSILFIKELGVYPPGMFVKLANGETAIVIQRGKESTSPTVSSVISPREGIYARPLMRDCTQKEYAIKAPCIPVKMLPFNLHRLWGYA